MFKYNVRLLVNHDDKSKKKWYKTWQTWYNVNNVQNSNISQQREQMNGIKHFVCLV